MFEIPADGFRPRHPRTAAGSLDGLKLIGITRESHRMQAVTTRATGENRRTGPITEEKGRVVTFRIRNAREQLRGDDDYILRRPTANKRTSDLERIEPARTRRVEIKRECPRNPQLTRERA